MKKEEISDLIDMVNEQRDSCGMITRDELIKNIQEIIQQNQTKDNWISVEDRLPENSGEFIVLTVDLDIDFDEYVIEKYGFDWYGKLVTHWQPLPEPPVNK